MSILELSLLLLPPIMATALVQFWTAMQLASAGHVELQVSGFRASSEILATNDASQVDVQQTPGATTDHYDPFAKVVRLSTTVYHGRTIAAVCVAAREACFAIQHRRRSGLIWMRGIAAGFAGFGTIASVIVLMMGVLLSETLIFATGVAALNFVLVVQLMNLPVELLASRNASSYLNDLGLVDQTESPRVKRVLRAKAYATLAAPLQFLLMLFSPLIRYLSGKR